MAGVGAGRADAVSRVAWYLTPELWLALVAGVDRLDADRAGARALARPRRRRPAVAAACESLGARPRWRCCSSPRSLQIAARTYNPFIYFRF